MIQIEALHKIYGTKKVLNGISIQFEQGKVYGIVGENGAGKTTLFKCICGLEKYQGSITATENSLKNHIGYLPTEMYFFEKITGREYIQLLSNARNRIIQSIEDKNIFNLPLDQYVSDYSTGMKKKLALTAILLQENQYYILDEPFNGVDIQSNLIITEIILELKRLGKTVLISSHIFATLKETCDLIFRLQEGKITQTVAQNDFDKLEKELKQLSIGNMIERLDLK
ncbi:ATP-binding cassette domain-containing protein [Flavobacterium sp.]|uniref:ABC transporter ATP-binding protein n=1 Tax=Flavobacterium sp. TaxID=239 RepID=UPI003D14C676